jgi:hypothetical protein
MDNVLNVRYVNVMDVRDKNAAFAVGLTDAVGLFPHLDALSDAPYVFVPSFGLDELPREPGAPEGAAHRHQQGPLRGALDARHHAGGLPPRGALTRRGQPVREGMVGDPPARPTLRWPNVVVRRTYPPTASNVRFAARGRRLRVARRGSPSRLGGVVPVAPDPRPRCVSVSARRHPRSASPVPS